MSGAAKTPITDLLRNIKIDAHCKIEEPNGWSYYTNIGHITHEAADKIDADAEEITRLRAELVKYKQYVLELDRELQTGEPHAKI